MYQRVIEDFATRVSQFHDQCVTSDEGGWCRWGEQARFFIGLTMMTTDDAARGLTSPTRWFSSVIGLHQIF